MGHPLINAGHVHDVYTNGETVIGYWIDGKPIYRKVVPFTITNTTTEVIVGAGSIAQVVRMDGIINMGGAWRTIPWAYAQGTATYVPNYIGAHVYNGTADFRVQLLSGSTYNNMSGYMILEYTKTTD